MFSLGDRGPHRSPCCVLAGLYTLQPNEAAILQLFGAYRGTSRVPGLRATNPFYTRKKLSLRARNLNGDRLKVNDKRGNPIEIAAVVVWHVDDTAKAAFDVDDYENFVKVQSEAAVRHLASSFAYDAEIMDDDTREPTLLESADIVARALEKELQARLEQAGVVVEEARLMHLAYAPEIAQVMLRRQQAEAIIAARTKIVHGAVSMVEMALHELSAKQVVDARRRAQGGDGVEPHDRAVRRIGSAAGDQHRNAVQLTEAAMGIDGLRLLFVLAARRGAGRGVGHVGAAAGARGDRTSAAADWPTAA